MGTWGYGISSDDTARDAYDGYILRFNFGLPDAQIVAELTRDLADDSDDPAEALSFCLGLAKAQWECGRLSHATVDEIEECVRRGVGLERWAEAGRSRKTAQRGLHGLSATDVENAENAAVRRRRAALESFAVKLRTPNPRPRKPRRPRPRKPPFEVGACLSLRLDSGEHAAAIVLAHPPKPAGPYDVPQGEVILGVLDYKWRSPAPLAFYERRRWLLRPCTVFRRASPFVSTVCLEGFRKHRASIKVAGHTDIRADDPHDGTSSCGWNYVFGMLEHVPSRGPGKA